MHRRSSRPVGRGSRNRDERNQRDADENDCLFPPRACALLLFDQRMIVLCAHLSLPFRVDVTSVANRAEEALSVR
jgi:hypothetical protein